jgi:hypothetical protein
MKFVEFEKKQNRQSKDYVVTITSSGDFVFNSKCCSEIFNKYSHIIFLSRKDQSSIAVQPHKKPKKNSYRLSFTNKTKTSAKVSGRSFLSSIGFDYKKGKKSFIAEWDGKRRILIMNLNK